LKRLAFTVGEFVMPNPATLEVARRAEKLYEERLRQELEARHPNEFVAIEPDSGEYFLASTLSGAIQAARTAHPERIAFALHVGHPTAVNLGVLSS
jgi:hypothetical protein